MNDSAHDGWLGRSRQRWKLRGANIVLLGGTGYGLYLFVQASWPTSFHGALIVLAATPLAAVIVGFIRCSVCDHRVAFDAPFGRWWSYTLDLQTCPVCGDDGEARPVAANELPVWFQVARENAAKERARKRVRRLWVIRIAIAAGVVATAAWFWTRHAVG